MERDYNSLFQMQPLGDPTVLKFQSRDLDGFLTVSISTGLNSHFKAIEDKVMKIIMSTRTKY